MTMRDGVFVLMLLSCACTGSDGDGGQAGGTGDTMGGGAAQLSTGLPADRLLADLTESEAAQLCQAASDWYLALIGEEGLERDTCVGEAVRAASGTDANGNPTLDQAACEAAVETCLAEDREPMLTPCNMIALQASLAGCRITVREWEACTAASLAFSAERADTYSCANFAMAFANPADRDASTAGLPIPECAPVPERCPQMTDP